MFTVVFGNVSKFLIILLMARGQNMLIVTDHRLIPPNYIDTHCWYLSCISTSFR